MLKKKGSTKIKCKNFLIVRIHDIIKTIPDFAVHPKNCPSVPMVSELDQLLSEILQILKKKIDAFCIIIELIL